MNTSTDSSFLLSDQQCETLLQETKQTQLLKNNNQLTLLTKQYHLLKRYDILKIGDCEKLIENGSDSSCDSKIVSSILSKKLRNCEYCSSGFQIHYLCMFNYLFSSLAVLDAIYKTTNSQHLLVVSLNGKSS